MTSNLRQLFRRARRASPADDDDMSVSTARESIVVPKRHPEYLRLIISPVAGEDDDDDEHGGHDDHHATAGHEEKRGSSASVDSLATLAPHADEPRLKMPHEAPTIELFYDLYFVANLTVFSSQHEIHSWNALRSYLGLFTMLWFTWFQNTLFDVRFSNDSAFERLCKVLQFGVMTGLAMSGPGFVLGFEKDSDDAKLAVTAFKTLALILMASRFILAVQYTVALVFMRSYRRALLPMIAHIATLVFSAGIFLTTFFLVDQHRSQAVLSAWYIVVVLEAAVVLVISGRLHFLSFRKTYLVERLGLLTLIILGEGIMTMCFALYSIGSVNAFTPSAVGQIICCVVIVYCMWMLYFDAVQPERMGALRQHAWAVLHFPFHASVVFVVEGMAGLAIWRKVLDVTAPLKAAVGAVAPEKPTWEQVVALNRTMSDMVAAFLHPTSAQSTAAFVALPDQSESFETLVHRDVAPAEARAALRSVYNAGLTYVCGKFKIEAHVHHRPGEAHEAEPDTGDPTETDRMADALFELFETVFIYFFAFAGAVLVLMAVLYLLGRRHKLPAEYGTVAVRMVVGVGLGLLAVMAAPSLRDRAGHQDALHHFLYSSWVLPTVVFAFLLVIILDNVLMRVARKDSQRRAARAMLEKEAQERAFSNAATPGLAH